MSTMAPATKRKAFRFAEYRTEGFRRELEPFLATEVNVEVDRIPLADNEQVAMPAGEIASIEVFLLVGEAGRWGNGATPVTHFPYR